MHGRYASAYQDVGTPFTRLKLVEYPGNVLTCAALCCQWVRLPADREQAHPGSCSSKCAGFLCTVFCFWLALILAGLLKVFWPQRLRLLALEPESFRLFFLCSLLIVRLSAHSLSEELLTCPGGQGVTQTHARERSDMTDCT